MDEILDYCIRIDGIPSQTIEFTPEREKKYGWNNGKVSFFDEKGNFYVTPFCVEVSRMLKEKGYSDGYLYVPFSNGESPEDPLLRERWEKLCLEARAVSREREKKEKEERFRKAAEEKGLKPLPEGAYEMCLRIPEEGLKTSWFGQEGSTFPLLEWEAAKYMGTYCQNNGKVSFIDDKGVMYVSPYSEEIKEELRKAGYSQGSLYVPLSNGEDIVDPAMNEKWAIMCVIARRKFNERVQKEKLERYHRYADEKGISPLPQEVYDMCLEIPEEGLRTSWFGQESKTNPLLEYQVKDYMGVYCQNNGRVSFVDDDGKMHVTPYCYDVPEKLAEAGYRQGSIYVPLSNGEDLIDPELDNRWASLCEDARIVNEERRLVAKRERLRRVAEEKGLEPLPQEVYDMCIEIPENGLEVTWFGEKSKTFPVTEYEASQYMGVYCQNNGRVSFIDESGKMFVTPYCQEVSDMLDAVGYKEKGLYVPLSNGEDIVDPVKNERWHTLCEGAREAFNDRQARTGSGLRM